jgi:hypothetical protein
MAPEWVDFLVMTGTFLLVAAGGLVWMLFFRKTRRRRHRHHHRHSRPFDITHFPKGGPPPVHPEEKTSGPPPTP